MRLGEPEQALAPGPGLALEPVREQELAQGLVLVQAQPLAASPAQASVRALA